MSKLGGVSFVVIGSRIFCKRLSLFLKVLKINPSETKKDQLRTKKFAFAFHLKN